MVVLLDRRPDVWQDSVFFQTATGNVTVVKLGHGRGAMGTEMKVALPEGLVESCLQRNWGCLFLRVFFFLGGGEGEGLKGPPPKKKHTHTHHTHIYIYICM